MSEPPPIPSATPDDWPLRRDRPLWWATPDDRDREASAADSDAEQRDQAALCRDDAADRRDQGAAARESEATAWLMAAHHRLTQADSEDARRLAEAMSAVELARSAYADTERSGRALIEAEAACEAETIYLVRAGIERQAIREDLDRVAQLLAAATSDSRAGMCDRAHARADRQAAADDRGRARTHRQQAAVDRASDPFSSLQFNQ